jgi:hypothetical protein
VQPYERQSQPKSEKKFALPKKSALIRIRDRGVAHIPENGQLLAYYQNRIKKQQQQQNTQQVNPVVDFARQKRFYPMHVNIGCVKGISCCEDPKCKPFCSMCYGNFIKSSFLIKSYSHGYGME